MLGFGLAEQQAQLVFSLPCSTIPYPTVCFHHSHIHNRYIHIHIYIHMTIPAITKFSTHNHTKYNMSVKQEARVPLGEFSRSRLNTMPLSRPIEAKQRVLKSALKKMPAVLPPFQTFIQQTQLESPSKIILKSITSNNLSNVSNGTDSKENHNSCAGAVGNKKHAYSDLSKKLQIRLQFAYYKYKTQQIDLSFSQLKTNKPHNVSKVNKTSKIKRRKLLVSQGGFKTPARVSSHTKICMDEVITNESKSTPSVTSSSSSSSLSSSSSSSLEKKVSFLTNNDNSNNHTDNTSIFNEITPVRNHTKQLPSYYHQQNQNTNQPHHQETPMSVKAAKSLLHLFSSTSATVN